MAKFTLEITCDNAAFDAEDTGLEVARILAELSGQFERSGLVGRISAPLRDINGNVVGHYSFDAESSGEWWRAERQVRGNRWELIGRDTSPGALATYIRNHFSKSKVRISRD